MKKRSTKVYLIYASSRADGASLGGVLLVGSGDSRLLDVLAQSGDVHGLPARDGLHALVELRGRASGTHVAGDVGVNGGTLLEDTNAVVVRASTVIGVVDGGRDSSIGKDLQAGLLRDER